jgi:hypothetical protein
MIQSRLYDDVEHHDAVLREIAGAGALNMSHVVLFLAGMAADAMRAAGFDEDELRANVDREIVELRAEIARR